MPAPRHLSRTDAIVASISNATTNRHTKPYETAEGKMVLAVGIAFSVCIAILFYGMVSFLYYFHDERRKLTSQSSKTGEEGGYHGRRGVPGKDDGVTVHTSTRERDKNHAPPPSPSWRMVYSIEAEVPPMHFNIQENHQPVAWLPQPYPSSPRPATSARIVMEPAAARVLTLL
jgi:hypothetical protein